MCRTAIAVTVTLFVSLTLLSVSRAVQPAEPPGKITRMPWQPPEKTELNGEVSVDIRLDDGQRPVVTGRVNGEGPFRFGIDWGANVVLVSEKVIEKAGLKKLGKMPFGPDRESEVVVLNELAIGEARFRGVAAAAGGFLDDSIDGVLGFNAFADVLMTLDFPEKKLHLKNGELPEVDGKDVLRRVAIGGVRVERTTPKGDDAEGTKPKAEFRQSDSPPDGERPQLAMPVVEMKVGDETFSAFLDTRGPGIFLPEKKMDAFTVLSGPVEVKGRNSQLGELTMKSVRVAEPLTVGRHSAEKPVVTFWGMELAVLGTPFLHHFAITLDQKNGRIRFVRKDDGPIRFPKTEWEGKEKEPDGEPGRS